MVGHYRVEVAVDDAGDSPYEAFEANLSPQCLAKAGKLRVLLALRGPTLGMPHAQHLEGPVWELRELCDGGALRIYYWQAERDLFVLACGEVKKRNRPTRRLIDFALHCSEQWKR